MTQSAALRVVGLVLVIALAAILLLDLPGVADRRSLWVSIPVLVIGLVSVMLLKRVGRK